MGGAGVERAGVGSLAGGEQDRMGVDEGQKGGEAQGIGVVDVSLSHERGLALATAVALADR